MGLSRFTDLAAPDGRDVLRARCPVDGPTDFWWRPAALWWACPGYDIGHCTSVVIVEDYACNADGGEVRQSRDVVVPRGWLRETLAENYLLRSPTGGPYRFTG